MTERYPLVISPDVAEAVPSAPLTVEPLIRPTTRNRISDAVFERLSELIRNLQLPPGGPISEPGIAAALQVSRSPVREAFTRLVDLGLITVVPQVGSYVAPISVVEVEDAVFVRQSLETSAFLRAIENGVPDVSAIQRFVDENRAAMERRDVEAFFASDEDIHHSIFNLAGVPMIWDIVRGAKMQLDRLRRVGLDRAMLNPELVEEHQRIVDALRSQDAAAGIAVIAKHSQRILHEIDDHRAKNPGHFAP